MMNKLGVLSILSLIGGAFLVACDRAAPPAATPLPPTATPVPTTATSVPPLPTPVSPLPTPESPLPTPAPPAPLVIFSSAFEPGGEIPERHGFFRENLSPELTWDNVPEGTHSLALLMEDRDFPFSHWVVYNIPPDASGLPEGVPPQPRLPDGTTQGSNTNEQIGYAGPYPPPGERHRYAFVLYALDAPLNLEPGATREQVLAAMEGHILATGELIGTYVGVAP